MKYPNKTVCIVDHGMYINVALKLSEDFGTVYYYTPWEGAFPKSNDTLPGFGYKEFKRINRIWDKIDEIDLFVFTDIYHSDMQEYLVSLGKRVWGARQGDSMEIYRWDFLQYMKKIGLAVPDSELIVGVDNLRKALQKTDDVFVKMDAMERGDAETFHHITYDLTKPLLDDMQHTLGAKASIKKFIIQHPIETDAEIGYDGWTIDGKFPDMCIVGIEVKDQGYIGKVEEYAKIPKEIRDVNEKLSATLKRYGYRGNFSTEIRVAKDGTPYLIDPTCRMPCPPTSVMLSLVGNMAEVMYEGADGKVIVPEMTDYVGAQFLLYSDFANSHFYNLQIPKDVQPYVTQSNSCIIDGITYTIPMYWDSQCVAEVVATGSDVESVIKKLKTMAESIKGFGLKVNADCLSDAITEFNKM